MQNDDLISRKSLLSKMDGMSKYQSNFEDAVEMVVNEPAEQMLCANWINRESVKGQVYCSKCGTIEKVIDSNYKSPFCPGCGMRMI